MANLVKIQIYANPQLPNPTLALPDVPWYAGITALQAMVIGEALHANNFSFRVVYRSIYGAFVDAIDGLADGDKLNHYWMLYINGQESNVGASEAIIQEDNSTTSAVVEWRYADVTQETHIQADLKLKPLS